MTPDRRIALRIASTYAVVGALWILFSDQLLTLVATDVRSAAILGTVKGWLFVAVTASLLFGLVSRHVKTIVGTEQELRRRNEELVETGEELIRQMEELRRSQRGLHDTTQTLQAIFQASPVAIVAVDTDGFVTLWNETAQQLFGWREDEVIGQQYPLLPPSELATFRHRLERTLQGDSLELSRQRRMTKGGTLVEVELASAPLYDEGGAVCGAVVALADWSEQQELERNLELTQIMVDHAAAGIGIIARDGRLVMVNDTMCRVLGYGQDELHAMTVLDIDPALTPELWQRRFNQIRRDGSLVFEVERRRRDGSMIPVEVTATYFSHCGEEYFCSFATDITGRRVAEQALRGSEELFRQLFTQNEDAIVLLTPESFDVIDANPAAEELLGFPREDLVRLGPWSFIAPDDYRSFIQAVPRLSDRPFHLDRLNALKMDGTPIFVSIWGKTVRLREKEVIYCSIRDITERVRMEEEMKNNQARLIHANKMASLGVLVSGIAHEINNPNSYISVNATLLRDVWRDASPVLDEYAEEQGDFSLGGLPFSEMRGTVPKLFTGLVEGSRRISAIVNNLKDFAREDTGGLSRTVDVNRVLRDAVTILDHHIHKLTDRFTASYADPLPPVRGNQQQIEQVIINLVMNALQALPERSRGIEVATRHDAERQQVVITVRDEGKGMSRRVMERITEPFFSTRLDQGGTGLGLSISASIVKEHHGSLEFESLPRQGTTATVRLPVNKAD